MQSDQRQAPNTIKLPQNKQMVSIFGNYYPQRWQLYYPNLTES